MPVGGTNSGVVGQSKEFLLQQERRNKSAEDELMPVTTTRLLAVVTTAMTLLLLFSNQPVNADTRPNIVWIVVEDMSLPFGCYGETAIETPSVDALAERGVKFTQAFVTAPVCSACRSAMITGMYQTSIGAHLHRSGRGRMIIPLEEHVKLIPQLFREAGYFTSNSNAPGSQVRRSKGNPKGLAKTDYNFKWDEDVYDGNHWRERKSPQPFFAQYQLKGGKGRTTKTPNPVNPSDVTLPPYYPDDPVMRDDWAQYLNSAMNTDLDVGHIVDELREAGELDNTYIFFMTDHGISHVRGKQFLYEEGIRIPFVIAGPKIQAGTIRDDLIVHIDMAATSLALAGIPVPDYMEGQDLLAENYSPREFIVAARDRCDETVDRLRCVHTDRFKYIRNFYPDRPYLQPNTYKDNKPILKAMRRLHAEGKLTPAQSLIMATTRPAEELYDLKNDPHELHNLAENPEYAGVVEEQRERLKLWIRNSGDRGRFDESDLLYDSDMKVYLDAIRIRKPDRAAEIEANIALMKKWKEEGR